MQEDATFAEDTTKQSKKWRICISPEWLGNLKQKI
jgi:hypothetical protein